MTVTVALAGDTMLGRGVARALATTPPEALVAAEVRAALGEADLVVVNLECCISERGRPWDAPGKPFFFRGPPRAVELLALLGTDCVTLANNHALDYGIAAAGRLVLADPLAAVANREEIDAIAARLHADEADPGLREYTGPVDRLVPLIGDAEVLLVHAAPVSRAAVRAAGALRVVGTVRGGTVNLNLDALSERGIPVFNTPGRNAQAVAEFVAGALIAHLRGIVAGATALHDGRWSMGPWTVDGAGMELAGKTCGIVGFGQVARAFTPIARGIGMRVLATDPWVDPAEVERAGVEPVGLDELLRRADVVALMARYDGDNRHLIDAAALARMRPTAVLVNTARPQLVDTEALRAALRERRIAGAIVDVFDQEPPAGDDELLGLSGTLLTPHIAGASRDTVVRGADLLAARIVRHLVSGDLLGAANLAAIQPSDNSV